MGTHPHNTPAVPTVTLHPGETGELVLAAQKRLFHLGYPVAVDGVFGPAMVKVVRSFQAENPAFTPSVTGVVDGRTWAAMFNPFARVLPRKPVVMASAPVPTPAPARHAVRFFRAYSPA